MNLSRIKSKFGITKFINKIDKTRGSRTKWLGSKEKLGLICVMIILSLIIVIMLKWSAFGIVLGICLFVNSVVAFLGWYRFITTKTKNIFREILTVFCLVFVALFYTPVLLIFIIYNVITQRINLKYLSRYIELFFLLFGLATFTAAFIYYSTIYSEIYFPKNSHIVKMILYIVSILIFNLIKVGFVHLVAHGKEKAYTRYKIYQELQYIGEYIVSVFLLLRYFFNEKDIEMLFSIFLFVSAITVVKQRKEYFKANIKQIECLRRILSDLEKCGYCLDSIDEETVLRVRFLFDTTFLGLCCSHGKKKVKNAMQSIFYLVYLEKPSLDDIQNKQGSVFHLHTYNCTAANLRIQVNIALNEIAKAL